MTKRRTRLSLGLLALTLWPLAWAAPLPRSEVWRGIPGSPGVTLAAQQLELARLRLGSVQGWQVSATTQATLAKAPAAADPSSDLSAGLRVVRPGPAALDSARSDLAQAVRRAEFAVQQATLAEWRTRTEAWNDLAEAQADGVVAALSLQAAILTEQSTAARLAQGAATDLQVQAARLERQRAELAQAQAQLRLGRARTELGWLGLGQAQGAAPAASADWIADAWAALPRPDGSTLILGPRSDLLEAELSAEAAAVALAQARRDAWPNLSAQAQYSQGRLNATGSVDRNLNVELGTGVSLRDPGTPAAWSLGLTGTLSLDGRAARQVKLAADTLALAQTTLARTRERAVRDVQAKQSGLQGAQQNLELAQAALDVQRRALEVAAQRRAQGLTGELEVVQAEANAAKAAQGLTEAQRLHDQATLQLWEALGWLPGNLRP